MSESLLFEDKDVKITNFGIYIKCYYFPFGNPKFIRFQQIQRAEVQPLGLSKLRIWGMSAFLWGYWFAGDCNRVNLQQFILLDIGSCIVPSFTTQNTMVVFSIITSQLNKIKEKNRNGAATPSNNYQNTQNSVQRLMLHQ